MKHTPFHGWPVVDDRTKAALDAGYPEWASLPISRKENLKRPPDQREKFYFTGKPCSRGHVAPRSHSGGNCSCCDKRLNIVQGYLQVAPETSTPKNEGVVYYTYVFFADGVPVYVGKGRSNRFLDHLYEKPELAGLDLTIRIIWAASEGEALAREAALIRAYLDAGHMLLNQFIPQVPKGFKVVVGPVPRADVPRVEVSLGS